MGEFGTMLRAFRIARGFSQEELAERARLSTQAVSSLERGVRRAPYRGTVALLADALELAAEDRARFEAAASRRSANEAVRIEPAALPQQSIPLIGRADDLHAVTSALIRSDTRLVTITGIGGIGKTHLAIAAARTIAAMFPGGVAFVSLASIADAAFMYGAICAALKVRDDGRDALDALAERFPDRPVLLVLDNLEQVEGAAEAVTKLLGALANVHVLATSTQPLQVRSEHRITLQPLGRESAVELFVQRAASAGVDVYDVDRALVGELCARIDFLPLAIELAAASLHFDTVQTLYDRLADPIHTLAEQLYDLPERHRSLRSAIEWSLRRLDADERQLLAFLAVFSGAFAAESAIQAWRHTGAEHEAAELLRRLVSKSLLQRSAHGSGIRLSMLQTVRRYMLDDDSADAVRARYLAAAAYYAELVEAAEAELTGREQRLSIQRLDDELDNIRGMLTWLLAADECEIGLRIAGALWRYWTRRGYLHEGLRWLRRFLAHPSALTVPARTRSRALLATGMLALRAGETRDCESLLRESLHLARLCRDERTAFFVLNSLGKIAQDEERYTDARVLFEESLDVRRRVGKPRDVVVALNNLAHLLTMLGEEDAAERLIEESLGLEGATADPWAYSMTLHNQGLLAARRGAHAAALRSLNEALILRYETQDRLRIVATLLAIGDTYRGADQLDEAFEHYVRAWREGEDLLDRDEALARIEALGIEATRAFLDGEASALAEESIDIA